MILKVVKKVMILKQKIQKNPIKVLIKKTNKKNQMKKKIEELKNYKIKL